MGKEKGNEEEDSQERGKKRRKLRYRKERKDGDGRRKAMR